MLVLEQQEQHKTVQAALEWGQVIYPESIDGETFFTGFTENLYQIFDNIIVSQIAVAENFSLALDCFGTMYSWGVNTKGQLG